MRLKQKYSIENLRPYQRDGVGFLVRNNAYGDPHKLLNWGMGTGKTPITCCALVEKKSTRNLIVSPISGKPQWYEHFIEWGVCKPGELAIVNRNVSIMQNVENVIVHFHELYDKEFFIALTKERFDSVIIDEVHKAKNLDSQITKLVYGLNNVAGRPLIISGINRFILSGTINPNGRPIELFPMLKRLCPKALDGEFSIKHRDGTISRYEKNTLEGFGRYFCAGYERDGTMDYTGASHLDELAERLIKSDFIDRKMLADVWQEMPEVQESRIFVEIDLQGQDSTNTHMSTLRNKIGVEKIPQVKEMLIDWLLAHPEEKILVFAFSTEVITKICQELFKFDAVMYYGKMTPDEKQIALDTFKQLDSCRVLIAQINSAGECINGLQYVCSTIWNLEEEWVPAVKDQAAARLVRYGQEKPVFIYHVVSPQTQDEIMISEQNKKQRNIDKMFHEIAKTTGAKIIMGLLEKYLDVLTRIAVALETMVGNGVRAGANPVVENQKPADKPGDKPGDKPAGKPNGKPKDKDAQTTTASNAEKQDTKQEPKMTEADVRKDANNILTRLKDEFKAQGVEDFAAAARELMGTVIQEYGASKVLDVNPDKWNECFAKLRELKAPETTEADAEALEI